jgi:hypothetical protein
MREFHKLAQKLDTKTQEIISTVVDATLGQNKVFSQQSEKMERNHHTNINTVFETKTALNEELLRRLEAALIKNKAQRTKETVEHDFSRAFGLAQGLTDLKESHLRTTELLNGFSKTPRRIINHGIVSSNG